MTGAKKTVYILIGPKGSGKTYIGQLLEKELDIRFLAVEPIFMSIKGQRHNTDEDFIREGFELVEEAIDKSLEYHNGISFEATGATPLFKDLVNKLRRKYTVMLVRFRAPLALCLERIKTRDASLQIPVSEELIEKVNRLSDTADFDYTLTIDNSGTSTGASDREIIDSFKTIL